MSRSWSIWVALMLVVTLGLSLVASSGATPDDTGPGSWTPDPQVLADGEECFQTVQDSNDVTCSVLYAHITDLLDKPPVTVQAPPEGAPDLAAGFTGTPGLEPASWTFSRMDMVPSRAEVHYADSRLAQVTRGLGDSFRLSPHGEAVGYWYLSSDAAEFSPLGFGTGEGGAGALACMTVEMRLRDGVPEARGMVLAEGKTTRSVVSAELLDNMSLPLDDPCPDSTGIVEAGAVHEFKVPLGSADAVIDQDRQFHVQVLWYQVDPSGDPDQRDKVVQREWNLRTGPDHRPRVVIPVENPVNVRDLQVKELGGDVVITAQVTGPWGSWEFVDGQRVSLSILDAQGEALELEHLSGPIMRYTLQTHMDNPLNVTWTWSPDDETDLPPGPYTYVFEAGNLQGTAKAQRSVEHTPAAVTESPGPLVALWITITLLAALGLGHRRRERL